MAPDYRAIEADLCVCRACESLVPAAEMLLSDKGGLCYPCGKEASGAVSLSLELVVGGGA